MSDIRSLDNVVYPPVGIAHLTRDVADLIRHKIAGRQQLLVTCAAQPNSHPHLGTVMTLMASFALGAHFRERFAVPVLFVFYELENSPGETEIVDGIAYERSLYNTFRDGRSLADLYMESFRHIFDWLSARTGIPASIHTYHDFQTGRTFRRTLLEIIHRADEFTPIVSPSEGRMHIRFPCPSCQLMDQAAVTVWASRVEPSYVEMTATCPQHGDHSIVVSERSTDYVDVNTPLRDIIKGAVMIENDRTRHTLSMTVAGSDWGGVWMLRIFSEGLALLGYRYEGIPVRFLTPIISDWSGAKFSKSLYVRSRTYSYLPEGFVDFSRFLADYGDNGLDRLWLEAQRWVEDPKKLFRDYSVDYFRLILEDWR